MLKITLYAEQKKRHRFIVSASWLPSVQNNPQGEVAHLGGIYSDFLLYHHVRNVFRYPAQFSSLSQSCLTLCDSIDCSMPGFPVHHQFLELAQTLVHRVGDAIQPSHPLSSPSPPSPPKSCYSSKILKTSFFILTYYTPSILVGVFRGEQNSTLEETIPGEEKEM